jgi:hypothetical protein
LWQFWKIFNKKIRFLPSLSQNNKEFAIEFVFAKWKKIATEKTTA